jgi:uncharacterized membrane protein
MPALAMVAALLIVDPLAALERSLKWELTIDPGAAQTVLATLAASMFTLIVFICSALLLAVQLASAQLSPRIIGMLFRDTTVKVTLALFVFTFTFTLAVLLKVNTTAGALTVRVAGYGSLVSLGAFLFLINHMGLMLRASGALRKIGTMGRSVIEGVYPRLVESHPPCVDPPDILKSEPQQVIHSTRDGMVLAFDAKGLVALAQSFDCIIEVVPQVGDFVAEGDPLFRVFQTSAARALPHDTLHHSIAIGPERTIEQDPAFSFRIIVDIASKALSPAINDPTTAVLALDEIHHLLRELGKRHLDDRVMLDSRNQVRVAYHTPGWNEFVNLGIMEIRHYGQGSIQVARRLRALLEDLIHELPESRAAPLRQELALLKRSAERFFAEPEDRALADVSDPQGVGGRQKSDNPT